NDLAFEIDSLRPRPTPEPEPEVAAPEPRQARAAPETEPAAEAPAPARREAVDPVRAPYDGFEEAFAANRLLTPTGSSAKHFLDVMIALDQDHELTRDALSRLSSELLTRANAAIIELDAAAAETWLDEAGRLGVNTAAVGDARERLKRRMIAAESARLVPVSELDMERYVQPVFPARALERAFEGWVDVEFTVGRDGST